MLEEKDDNLPTADGPQEEKTSPQETVTDTSTTTEETTVSEDASTQEEAVSVEDVQLEDAPETGEKTAEEHEEAVNELDNSVAEDAEDEATQERHEIPKLDYHSMSLFALVNEFEKLVKNEKVQAIKEHVDEIRKEFNEKHQALYEEKKQEFVDGGGQEMDFYFSSNDKKRFNSVYHDYKDKRNTYYKSLEQNLKQNLANRLQIIEELKGLISVEENINTTYKHFRELQQRWREAGPVPRMQYNNVWRTYHHHVERFYDFLHLNRDLRDLDFKHNLEEKQKLIEKAEALDSYEDVGKAFRELQTLHRVWKEEIGPVAREQREELWQRFSAATKLIHDKRQDYLKDLDKIHEQNLVKKQDIIGKIHEVASETVSSHGAWQKKIREIEALREAFFNAGRVPQKKNEETWANFKEAVRSFNRNKNAFYNSLKKDQQVNLGKKLELVKLAESLKDSEDWETTTPIMKKIQQDWKKIGHVPRKFSDKVWNDFKAACNHYFDRLHAQRNEANKEESEAFEKKKAFLDGLKSFKPSGDQSKDLETIKEKIMEWKALGRVPFNKRNIEGRFNKALDGLFDAMKLDRVESEMIRYDVRLSGIEGDDYAIRKERSFISRKVDEAKSEINQLENNLQFFSNSSEDNPLVKDVYKNLERHKSALAIWQAKLQKLRSL